ncbi:MAG TPA: hypothetical protein VD963_02505, partial [Phycisphaerales bacterium]|nr:hypothetical protein [Phycisphaerales bacterium]
MSGGAGARANAGAGAVSGGAPGGGAPAPSGSPAPPAAYEARRPGFLISTDPGLIDLETVHGFLTRVYWSEGIPKETVARGIAGALCFGVYDVSAGPPAQAGFARVITD